jgi:hypothetical protein
MEVPPFHLVKTSLAALSRRIFLREPDERNICWPEGLVMKQGGDKVESATHLIFFASLPGLLGE